MECNKDEANRAKEIAENKMKNNDFEGARKIALKAKKLYPDLDNISQLLAVCDIHCSSQKKINGTEMDLYGILQVERLADDATIKKQYRKLALILHPDKNNFPGAEAAFKLIGEANRILSDKEKRYLHDFKCRAVAQTVTSKPQNRQENQNSQFNGVNPQKKSFWTLCPFCKVKYEYYRDFVNKRLRCPKCLKYYVACEIGVQWSAAPPPSTNPGSQNVNHGSNTGRPVFKQEEVRKQERTKVDAQKNDPKAGGSSGVKKEENGDVNTEVERDKGSHKRPQDSKSKEAGDDLTAKRRCGGKVGDNKQKVQVPEAAEANTDKKEAKNKVKEKDNKSNAEDVGDLEESEESVYFDCEDLEFTNFDKDKEERCFGVDQIWACYDTIDSMPRFYAHIRKVYSGRFRVQINWLEADTKNSWAQEGLPVACGKFVRGDAQSTRDRLMFSHQMLYEKGNKFSYFIYPKKGEIWALFKDWDINWSCDPKNHMKYKFEIVEVVSDFNNNEGVLVAYMVKLQGFVSLFQKTSREYRIPAGELLRFSHRIPAVKLAGTERADVPVGSFELDTASLPDDLNEYYSSEKVSSHIPEPSSPPGGKEEKLVIHDFDKDKQNREFHEGQIWAIRNGNSQSYVQIKKIESSPPRVLHVELLESCFPSSDVIRPEACGLFKASRDGRQIFPEDSFLFIVRAELNGKTKFNIYPREKEIWVLLLENKHDSKSMFWDLGFGECEIVEVVDNGATMYKVLSLSPVPGYKSVFRAGEMKEIQREELHRFVSQVPAFLLTNEQDGSLQGSWELDFSQFPGLLSS